MKAKHFVLTVVVAVCAAAAYFWVTDSWPGQNAGVKNPEAGQAKQNAKAIPSAAPSPDARQPAPAPTAETAAAPEQTPAPRPDDGLPLFTERESLRVKLEGLEKNVKDIPTQREKAKAEPNDGTETKKFKQLMTDSGTASAKVREEFAEFEKRFAGLPQLKKDPDRKELPRLTAENVALASTISEGVKLWAVPLLALLSLLLILTLGQLWSLYSQAGKLRKDRHDLALDIQRLNDSGTTQESLLKEVKAVTEDQLPSINTQVADTKAAADSLRESVNLVLDHLALLPNLGAGGSQNFNYDQQQSSRSYAGQQDEVEGREAAKPHSFPVAVADYLNLVKDMSSHVKADPLNDVLVEASADEGDFVLVKYPPTEKDGTSYAIPVTEYFRTKQDFYNGCYPKYYDCLSQPPVGAVRIVRPAKVQKSGSAWRLAGEKGTLEVQQ